MGIYLNPGNENFKSIVSADIYVDKTMMLSVTNEFIDKGNKYVCMSRPRRFGKTIAGNMLSAYYSKGCDSSDIFSKFGISSFPGYREKMNKYNVIKIDMNSEYQNTKVKDDLIDILSEKVINEIREEYPGISDSPDKNTLAEAILEIFSKTKETFIIIIDEYDVLVREQVDRELFDRYLSFLNGLFKSDTLRPAISFAYLTGILPVVRDRIQSKLNNFKEFTMLNAGKYEEYIGFTEDEVRRLCKEYDVDFEECRLWYDGYRLNRVELYNPESVIEYIGTGEPENYWAKTSSWKVIEDRIKDNFEGLKDDVERMISGESVDVNVKRYLNTMDSFETRGDSFTYLIHTGYLTYDKNDKTCRIPNLEIRDEWYNAIEARSEYKTTYGIIKASKQLLMDTLSGNEEAVAKALDQSHIHVSNNRLYNNEDIKEYSLPFTADRRKLYKIGVSFDSKTRGLSGWKESVLL